jgi:hypothetical protein
MATNAANLACQEPSAVESKVISFDVAFETIYEYGSRVGVSRIFEQLGDSACNTDPSGAFPASEIGLRKSPAHFFRDE